MMDGSSIDFGQGIVHLTKNADLIDWNSQTQASDVPLEGRHLRFFYRADGDWSVQCQKAYSYYVREWTGNPIDYWHYKLVDDGGTPANGRETRWKLLFARCMCGQSVTVDYQYRNPDWSPVKMAGKHFRISDDVTSGGLCYVTLDMPQGATMYPSDRVIVVGSSFRARVIWRDGKAWRFVDIETSLTRNSAP